MYPTGVDNFLCKYDIDLLKSSKFKYDVRTVFMSLYYAWITAALSNYSVLYKRE